MTSKLAVIYDRASTTLQKDNWSRVNAKEVGIRIAEQNGFAWEYVKEIGSGTTLTGRPKMMTILDRIAAGEIQAIIVQDLDRLARPEEAVVYSTIRQVIMTYEVIIYTHTSRIDLNNDDDDFVADITMSVAKKERRRIRKRIHRGRKAKAEQGKFAGGSPGLGYTIEGNKNTADLIIDPKGKKVVKAIFDTIEKNGGNLRATAKQLNEAGYRTLRKKKFSGGGVRRTARRKLYIGIFEHKSTDKVTHRPDLQIISLDQFERVEQLIKSRAGNKKDLGRRGKYIFTGFVVCGNCGGSMVAANGRNGVCYQCLDSRRASSKCPSGKTYLERLILPPVIEFLAEFIQSELDFYDMLDTAAERYGKSITEEAVEAAITGELASVKAGKDRLVEAITLGVLTNQEAAGKLAELREQEQRLTVELSSIAEKTTIMAEWQAAIDSLKETDLKSTLYEMAEHNPIAFRQLLGLIFDPNSLRVKTEYKGERKWVGVLESYQLNKLTQRQRDELSFGTLK